MKNTILVGIVFFAIVALLFFQTILTNQKKMNQHPYRMKIYFSRIDGLNRGSEVYVKGIEYGFVLGMDIVDADGIIDKKYLDPNKKTAVEVTLALREPITLWDNYTIRFNTKSLFSERVIEIDPGYYPGDPVVYYQPTYKDKEAGISDFIPTARYVDNFFEGSNAVLVENKTQIRSIIKNTKEISEKLLGTQGTLPLLINTSDAYDELDATIAYAGILMREARRYQEGHRKLEQTHPIPFLISLSFIGGTTLGGRQLGGSESLTNPKF